MDYNLYRESKIDSRIIRHTLIKELVKQYSDNFKVELVGKSVLDREIYTISLGQGKKNIFLWSQMHGNEATATGALFDLLNYYSLNFESENIKSLLSEYTIVILPMLNPDGAENWTRVNELNIDLNRDAVKREAPESKILWTLIDKLKPEYSFNLHDQRNIFNVGRSSKTATISFLSASFDESRELNDDRRKTMSLIAYMNDVVQKEIEGHVGRYTDEFYPSATGDNLHKLSYKNVLIESGTYVGDPERQITRKMNFLSLLEAINLIHKGFSDNRVEDYNNIPENSKLLYDLIIRNVLISQNTSEAKVDIAFMYNEKPNEEKTNMVKHIKIENIGDLSQYIGIEEIDAKGSRYEDSNGNFPKLNSILDFSIGAISKVDEKIKRN